MLAAQSVRSRGRRRRRHVAGAQRRSTPLIGGGLGLVEHRQPELDLVQRLRRLRGDLPPGRA